MQHPTYDELNILAACLDADLGPALRPVVQRAWFEDERHSRLMDAIAAVEATGEPPAFMSLMIWLQNHHMADLLDYAMQNLTDTLLVASGVQQSIAHLRENYANRELAQLTSRANLYRVKHPDASADDVRVYLEGELARVSTPGKVDTVDAFDLVEEVCQDMLEMAAAMDNPLLEKPGLWFNIPEIDRNMGGLFPGQVCIVAARPGVGKTSLAIQFALEQAKRGKKALFCSYEMTMKELVERMIRQAFPMQGYDAYLGEQIAQAKAKLLRLPGRVWLHDKSETNDRRIRTIARHEQVTRGVDCIVIDYIQLVPTSEKNDNHQQEVSVISASLKATAKDLNVPVLLLSQFSRAAMQGEEPQLHHLRESGSLEQDADKVLLMWEGADTNNPAERNVRAKWAKNRQGPRDKFDLSFHADHFIFTGGRLPC